MCNTPYRPNLPHAVVAGVGAVLARPLPRARRPDTTERSSCRMAGVKTRREQLPEKAVGHCKRVTKLRIGLPCAKCDGPSCYWLTIHVDCCGAGFVGLSLLMDAPSMVLFCPLSLWPPVASALYVPHVKPRFGHFGFTRRHPLSKGGVPHTGSRGATRPRVKRSSCTLAN